MHVQYMLTYPFITNTHVLYHMYICICTYINVYIHIHTHTQTGGMKVFEAVLTASAISLTSFATAV